MVFRLLRWENEWNDPPSIHTLRILSYNDWNGPHPPVTVNGMVIFLRILSESEWNGHHHPSCLLSDNGAPSQRMHGIALLILSEIEWNGIPTPLMGE